MRKPPRIPTSVLALVAAAWVVSSRGADPKFALPREKTGLKEAPGRQVVDIHCLICHSSDYITTQPKLTRGGWTASVKKMREKYGAIIANDKVEPILDYLVANYGKPDPK
jgi:mono/diheme cytochrome c family protein